MNRNWFRCTAPECRIGGVAEKMYVPDLVARRQWNDGRRVPSNKLGNLALCLSHARRLQAENGIGYDPLHLAIEAALNTERNEAEAKAERETKFAGFAARFAKSEQKPDQRRGVVVQIRPGRRGEQKPDSDSAEPVAAQK